MPAKVNDLLDSWSPDGRQLAFISDAAGTFEIYAMNTDGSAQTQITNGPESHLAAWGSARLTGALPQAVAPAAGTHTRIAPALRFAHAK